MEETAPDFAGPIVGWRGWLVIPAQDGLRLCSPLYRTVWSTERATLARCHQRKELWKPSLLPGWKLSFAPAPPVRHAAPGVDCQCGVYAASSVGEAASVVLGRGSMRSAIGTVIGQVSLWGSVVECERGWRGACAYPARLYVPLGRRPRLGVLSGRRADPAHLGYALRAYRVPVTFVPCRSMRELARLLDGESSATRADAVAPPYS
jgi:hypothetical protein